jgi:hypothetical protein
MYFSPLNFKFSAASATIVAGTLAERCQMAAYLCYSVMLTGWVYPVIAHSVWSPHGFLSTELDDPLFGSGMVDFAGGGVVHLTGGLTALFATVSTLFIHTYVYCFDYPAGILNHYFSGFLLVYAYYYVYLDDLGTSSGAIP